jgi:methyltransferase FkbM-like protein
MSDETSSYSLRDFRPVHFDGLMRAGREFDGGYVVPRQFLGISNVLLSLGVNVDWSFEQAVLKENPSIRVTCVDGTTGLKRVVGKAAQKALDLLGHALTLQLRKARRDAQYLLKPLEFHRFFSRHELLQLMVATRSSADSVTLPMLLDRVTQGQGDCWVLLKMDIEGAEFDVLAMSLSELRQVSVLIVEFHRLDLNWARFVACMRELMKDFLIAHVHGNNFGGYIPGTSVPAALEVTLVSRRLVRGNPPPSERDYPLSDLDMPCNWKRSDLRFGFQ